MLLPLAVGQVAGSTMEGTVTDPTGNLIPNASVEITAQATEISRTISTNTSGFYSVPNLTPGIYRIEVSAPGFNKVVMQNVPLTVGAVEQENFSLKIGSVSETVQVSDVSPDVQLGSSSLSALANSVTVTQLPLNGRDWTSLATLEPSVATIRTQPAVAISNQRANRGNGVQLTIGGNRPEQNNYRIDGISVVDYTNGAPSNVLGGTLGVDAIQEFSVVTSNAPAEYGRSSGGVINAVTRSGSDDLHGNAYEFLRNSVFDARNYFDPAKIPPFKRNQFGGSVGAPIWRDHTFFFADYEGLRQDLGVTQTSTTLSQNARNGVLSTGNVTVDPKVVPFLQFYPLPNGHLSSNGDTGTFLFVGQQVANENFFTTRVDHNISTNDRIFGTYLLDRSDITQPDNFNVTVRGSVSRHQAVAVEETHVFSTKLVNSARFGFSRYVSEAPQTIAAVNPAASDATYGFVPGLPVGLINTSGLSNFAGGIGAVGEYNFHYNSYQAYDDAFLTHGVHSIKFGVSVERIQSNQLGTANPNGQYVFGSISHFLTNNPTSFNAPLSGHVTPRDLRQTVIGAYVQDDVRLRPSFTLNLGMRYEMATVPTETANRLTNLRSLTASTPTLGSPYFSNPTLRNFEPRLGFSWDPFRDGKTAVRGAFGMYDVLPLPYEFELISLLSAPFFESGSASNLPAGTFPNGGYALITAPTTLRYGYVQPDPKRNYVMQWNLNVQRQLANDLTLTVGYLGSRGVHQPFHADDVNYVLPTSLTPEGYLWPIPYKSGTKLNPNAGQISALFWNGVSSYHALNAEVTKRMRHGLQVQGSYSWSKSIDLGSASVSGDTFGNSAALPFFDPRLRRGLSDFDVPQVASINFIWMIPGRKSATGFPGWALNGWQFGGIFTASSGLPITPTIGGDPLGLQSAVTFAFPNRIDRQGCETATNPQNPLHYINTGCFTFPSPQELLGNVGRNSLFGPGLEELDLSWYKNNYIPRISEAFNIQFRFEVFNVANRANFANPTSANTQIFNASGNLNANAGVLTATATSSRQLQFGVKFIF
jgi:hypothetical protein